MPSVDRQQHIFQAGNMRHLLLCGCSLSLREEPRCLTLHSHKVKGVQRKKKERSAVYCLRSSTSLAVRPAISLMERRMSSLSLGSSHRSAMRLASANSARMFSSPSGPPWGSASQAWKNDKYPFADLNCNFLSNRVTELELVITL